MAGKRQREILDFMKRSPAELFTAAELGREIGVGEAQARTMLDGLEFHGLVYGDGRIYPRRYGLSRESLIEYVTALLHNRTQLEQAVVAGWRAGLGFTVLSHLPVVECANTVQDALVNGIGGLDALQALLDKHPVDTPPEGA